jgi:drug/metabolite transporter (DMT)-like permease
MAMETQKTQEGKTWKELPPWVRGLLTLFFCSLVALILIQPFVKIHPYFPWEKWLGFYAVFGFVACVALVLAAKYILRPLVRRPEDYYDR